MMISVKTIMSSLSVLPVYQVNEMSEILRGFVIAVVFGCVGRTVGFSFSNGPFVVDVGSENSTFILIVDKIITCGMTDLIL